MSTKAILPKASTANNDIKSPLKSISASSLTPYDNPRARYLKVDRIATNQPKSLSKPKDGGMISRFLVDSISNQRDFTKNDSSASISDLLEISPSIFHRIPITSPIYSLQFLETGWDGYWAEPLSKGALIRAHQLWIQIERITVDKSCLPDVRPSANGSIAFTWSQEYPEKELEVWLYDQPDYYIEWMLSVNDEDEEGIARSLTEILEIIKWYQES
jgi:hypothetical protein